jgi:protein TonB
MDNITPDASSMAVTAVDIDTNISLSSEGFGLSTGDGEYLPIVKVQPIYPRRALSRGIEGYVIVEFTVTSMGTTKDHVIVEAQPSGIFDRAAIQAAAKFKYKPRVVDGVAIEVPGVQNKITFLIEE